MNILVFDKFLGYNVGGAQQSLHALLGAVANDNHFLYLGCDVKKQFNADRFKLQDWNVKRLAIHEFKSLPYFEYWLNRRKIIKAIIKNQADLLIAQGLWGAIAIRYFSNKTVYFIRDEYQLNKIGNYHTGWKKILKYLYILFQLPFIIILFRDNKLAIKKADIVIANSEFIRKKIKDKFNKDAKVIYPLVYAKKFKEPSDNFRFSREFITVIGSELIKGRKIVEAVAAVMPAQKFMIVGREYIEPIWKNNILYYPWSNDVMEIYKKTKILLVPSICEEAFGRIALEATILKIPVLGSNKGGISEVLEKDQLVQDLFNILLWKEKIEKILNNLNCYNYDNDKIYKKLNPEKQLEAFREIINTI